MSRFFAVAIAPIGISAVPTPWGDRPARCVVKIPEGSALVNVDEGVAFRHLSGGIEPVHVADECREDGVIERHAAQRSRQSASDGWLDNKGFTHLGGISRFTGSFNVPADPPHPRRPQSLYYFFGMENKIDPLPLNILQPVLTWGDESEGAAGGWSVWSWACCPSFITFHSENVGGLQEGMIVDGVIERDSNTWRVDTAFTDTSGERKNTTLLADLPYRYTWADVTLEVYNLTSCGQHSPGKVTFTDLSLFDVSGAALTPRWRGASSSSCDGAVTVHDAATISIQHSTSFDITA